MIKIEISGNTMDEVLKNILSVVQANGLIFESKSAKKETSAKPVVASAPVDKKKPGRPASQKAKVEEVEADETEVIEADEIEESVTDISALKEPTKEDAIAAIRNLNTKKGFEAAKAALVAFKASKLDDLASSDYGKFISHCEKAAV